jgi:uncharacterized membrane protein YphA (DoxX/SURF4 family)
MDALEQPHTQLFLRLVLGALLLYAGGAKLADRASFRSAVAEYEVLPAWLTRPFAAALPLLEITAGALLLLGLATPWAASIAAALFFAFTVAIGANVARGRRFDCHCFGSTRSDEIGALALTRATALAVAALAVALGASRFGALEGALFGTSGDLPPRSDVIPVALLAALALDVLILLPETVALREAFARNRATRIAHRTARPS